MRIEAFDSKNSKTDQLLADLTQAILDQGQSPDFVALHLSYDVDVAQAQQAFGDIAPHALHGGTSCRGIMTQAGHHTDAGHGAGAFCIFDPDGDYGTGFAALDNDARAAATSATQAALDQADRMGEAPQLIWLSVTPGQEEAVLDGIHDVVGKGVPVLGGSAADNDIAGNWSVFDADQQYSNGVVVSVLFPSTRVSIAYQNGYVPSAVTGVITKAKARKILEIDHKPAAQVYADWTATTAPTEGTEAILSSSTFAPLGRDAFELKGVPYYLLAHPSASNADGSLDLFANVSEGETLTLMQGDADQLAARAGRVVNQARVAGQMTPNDVAGALVVFCGGCMLGVQDKMDDVVNGVTKALPDVPFLGVFTFGEQGPLHSQGNRHGNLMVSAIVFSSKA